MARPIASTDPPVLTPQESTIDAPAGTDVEQLRTTRDEIERRVRALLDELGVPAR